MTHQRGWCPCGGPLWRVFKSNAFWPAHTPCRLCWLEETGPHLKLTTKYMEQEARARHIADCNSTADTAATSTWLPRGAEPMSLVRSTTFMTMLGLTFWDVARGAR